MAESVAKDYASYFSESSLEKEMIPISNNIDQMLTRLEEFESILEIVKNDTSTVHETDFAKILAYKPQLEELCGRIDSLECFIDKVNENLMVVEKQVDVAEEELDIPDKTLNVFLKSINIFGKPAKTVRSTNINPQGNYQTINIFKTSDYFEESNL